MKRKTWLLLDCSYLVWRAHFAWKQKFLTDSSGMRTEIIYSFLRDLLHFQRLHNTQRLVFCFDAPPKKRKKLLPSYKGNRKKDPADLEEIKAVKHQMNYLRLKLLPKIGYRNILYQPGVEADDHIAMACQGLRKKKDQVVIVASDHDFFQLLRKRVVMWNPATRDATTIKSFIGEKGVEPKQWVDVKAIAGCSSDNIPGVVGVGEITAIRYLRGELKDHSKAYKAIKENTELIERNRQLIKLPIKGTIRRKLINDRPSQESWSEVTRLLDMKSLEIG